MSLFASPEEHAANPPSTWQVFRVADRSWQLRTLGGTVLDRFQRKRDAVAAKDRGWLRSLYDDEGRWYRGERTVNPWRPWAEVKAEQDRRLARAAR